MFTYFQRAGILEAKPMARILVINDDPDTREIAEKVAATGEVRRLSDFAVRPPPPG